MLRSINCKAVRRIAVCRPRPQVLGATLLCARLSMGQLKGLPSDSLQWCFGLRTAFVRTVGVLAPRNGRWAHFNRLIRWNDGHHSTADSAVAAMCCIPERMTMNRVAAIVTFVCCRRDRLVLCSRLSVGQCSQTRWVWHFRSNTSVQFLMLQHVYRGMREQHRRAQLRASIRRTHCAHRLPCAREPQIAARDFLGVGLILIHPPVPNRDCAPQLAEKPLRIVGGVTRARR